MPQAQTVKINENSKTIEVRTVGKGSYHMSYTMTTDANGSYTSSSDLCLQRHSTQQVIESNMADMSSSCMMNRGVYTPNGTHDDLAAAHSVIDGNVDFISSGGQHLAAQAMQKLVAARSQPESEPNLDLMGSLTNLLKPNGNVLKRAMTGTPKEEDVAKLASMNPVPNFAENPALCIASFVSQYTAMMGLCTAAGASQVAKIYAGDVKNNLINQKKNIEEAAENATSSFKKEEMLNAIASGDLTAIFKPISTENTPKEKTFDEDEYQNKIAEVLPEYLEASRMC